MRMGIEEFKRKIGKMKDEAVFIEVTYRGEVVMEVTPKALLQPHGSEAESRPNRMVRENEPHGSRESIQNQGVASRLEKARQALANANSTVGLDPEPAEEVRIWVEDGIEHRVTKSQIQAKFGKQWSTFWKKAAA